MYPLYYTLCSNIPDKNPGKKEIESVTKKVKKSSLEERQAMFFLIIEHARVEEGYVPKERISKKTGKVKRDLPYRGRSETDSVEFDIDKLPPKLVWILARFATLKID